MRLTQVEYVKQIDQYRAIRAVLLDQCVVIDTRTRRSKVDAASVKLLMNVNQRIVGLLQQRPDEAMFYDHSLALDKA